MSFGSLSSLTLSDVITPDKKREEPAKIRIRSPQSLLCTIILVSFQEWTLGPCRQFPWRKLHVVFSFSSACRQRFFSPEKIRKKVLSHLVTIFPKYSLPLIFLRGIHTWATGRPFEGAILEHDVGASNWLRPPRLDSFEPKNDRRRQTEYYGVEAGEYHTKKT